MPNYLSPGVYVEEVPAAVQAIAGVGTSTAGFIGLIPDDVIVIPPGPVYEIVDEIVDETITATNNFALQFYPVKTDGFTVKVTKTEGGASKTDNYDKPEDVKIENDSASTVARVVFIKPELKTNAQAIKVTYKAWVSSIAGEYIGVGATKKSKGAEGEPERDEAVSAFKLAAYPVVTKTSAFTIQIETNAETDPAKPPQYDPPASVPAADVELVNDHRSRVAWVKFKQNPPSLGTRITASYYNLPATLVMRQQKVGVGDGKTLSFKAAHDNIMVGAGGAPDGLFQIRVGNYDDKNNAPKTGVTIQSGEIVFPTGQAPLRNQEIWADYLVYPTFRLRTEAETAKLCTSFGEFKKYFGDFSTDRRQNILAHAVYGFFHNGGTRCFVARMTDVSQITKVLENFAAIDEIALVAAPGLLEEPVPGEIVAHCKVATQDRFAILDSKAEIAGELTKDTIAPPPNADYAAFYFPWLQVFDVAKKTIEPASDGRIFVPPSGHIAGIYARVDNTRGVHKAPANEVVLDALGLRYALSKAQQDGLNPHGINCIRELNGNIRVWGARTLGGDANGEWRYLNIRRTFLYLRESIDEGTQWVVFEPNDQNLWAKITRNITAFLTNVWRAGALFGATPQEAFYVKCDAETNPPELRDLGQVVTEIGVAMVKPAEFVIFRLSQWQPAK